MLRSCWVFVVIPGAAILAGQAGLRVFDRFAGPVEGIAADPVYIDVSVPPGKRKSLPVPVTSHAFAYVFAGSGTFCNASGPLAVPTEGVQWSDTHPPTAADDRSLVLFDSGDEVTVQAGEEGIRFLLVSGRPQQRFARPFEERSLTPSHPTALAVQERQEHRPPFGQGTTHIVDFQEVLTVVNLNGFVAASAFNEQSRIAALGGLFAEDSEPPTLSISAVNDHSCIEGTHHSAR